MLVSYAKESRDEADQEIDRLIESYPAQHLSALMARTTLIALEAAGETNLARLDHYVAALPEGEKGFLRQTPSIKSQVADIVQAQRRLDTVTVPAFRVPLAAQLVHEIEAFRDRIGGLRYPLPEAFRPAAQRWLEVAREQALNADESLKGATTPQVFRAGDPVDRAREAFVPRLPVIEELQGQITLATGCPGVLLYGRRPIGNSTLIRNLQPFLPTSIAVASMIHAGPTIVQLPRGLRRSNCRIHSIVRGCRGFRIPGTD